MKIRQIACYAADLRLVTGEYVMSRGRRLVGTIPTTVVAVTAEDGSVGYGESCAIDGAYIEGFDRSVQETVRKLAPSVFATAALDRDVLVARMDAQLRGHLAGKAAIDAAVWDLRGKLLNLPVATLLGGIHQPTYRVFYAVSHRDSSEMAAEVSGVLARGYDGWQVKVGGDPLADAERAHMVVASAQGHTAFVTCDANRSWSTAEASQFIGKISDLTAYVEQPCRTLAEVADLRRRSPLPIMIDEAVCDMEDLFLSFSMHAADAINIKPSRVGGLTKAAQLRDAAQAAGWMIVIDESMGGHLATAGVAHLAASCRPEHFLGASCITASHIADDSAACGVDFNGGRAAVPTGPGLGIEIDAAALGEPEFSISATASVSGGPAL